VLGLFHLTETCISWLYFKAINNLQN